MGQPKLLMPLAGQPLIAHTLAAWQRSRVDQIFVVVRPGDKLLLETLNAFQTADARLHIVVPETAPPDMKASVQAALRDIETHLSPTASDVFLVAPADMPRLSTPIINRLIEQHVTRDAAAIRFPTLAGQRGHPVMFPWPLTNEVFTLRSHEGLNAIVDRHAALPVNCEDLVLAGESSFTDIDTPDDYQKLAGGHESGQVVKSARKRDK